LQSQEQPELEQKLENADDGPQGAHGTLAETPSKEPGKQASVGTPRRSGAGVRAGANSGIDANMWQHFQNLLRKNDNNPYLKEALQRQNSHGAQLGPLSQSQQQISRNFKKYIDDLTLRLANGRTGTSIEDAGRVGA